jgi:hypothetical protein
MSGSRANHDIDLRVFSQIMTTLLAVLSLCGLKVIRRRGNKGLLACICLNHLGKLQEEFMLELFLHTGLDPPLE